MKWVFFLLLAANLGYFFLADESQPESPPPIPPPAPTGEVANILLLSEATQRGLYPLPEPPTIARFSVVHPEQPAPSPAPVTDQPLTIGDANPPQLPATDPDPAKETASAPVAAPAPPASAPIPAETPEATAASPAPGAKPEPEQPPSETNTVPPSAPATANSTPESGPAQPVPANNAPTDVAADRSAEPLATSAKAPKPPSAPHTDDQTTAANEESTNGAPSPSVEPPPVPAHDEQPPAAPADNGNPQADAPPKCHRMGPFKRATEVSAVRTRAGKLGLDGRILRATQRTPKRYRVYLGPYETTKTLEFDQRELEANGYNGVTVSQNDQLSTLVIARFDTRPQAKTLLADLRRLGYKPRISQEYRRLTRYYLVLPPATNAKSTQATKQLEADFPRTPLTPVDCPRPPNT